MLKKLLEKKFDSLFKRLKPPLREKAIFLLHNIESPKKNVIAQTETFMKPPTIHIYLKTFEKVIETFIHENMRELITHELIHAIGIKEEGLEDDEHNVNFFEDDKNN